MILHLQDLAFHVTSPSCYVMASVRDDIDDPSAKVSIEYNGFKWLIRYRSKSTNIIRPFKSRDAAIALIRDRAP